MYGFKRVILWPVDCVAKDLYVIDIIFTGDYLLLANKLNRQFKERSGNGRLWTIGE